ncbi:MAG: CHAP domain-containing protein [Planctomycetales bacterium]|nr:CHAP domain-containing protein [bacterium]UNM09760.1 MAG: CHAP domain-containing protein [Planctomycetales bacterium]
MGKTPLQLYKELPSTEQISAGDRSWHVKLLRRMLAMAGAAPIHWMNPAVDVDWHFDDNLLTLVHAFQNANGLPVSDSVDDACWKKLAEACETAPVGNGDPLPAAGPARDRVARRIVEIAQAAEARGIREHGSNSGATVRMLLRHAGLDGAFAWCMAFVWAVVDLAYFLEQQMPPVLEPVQKRSCSNLVAWARLHHSLIENPLHAQPGDLWVQRGGETGFKHVGVITGVSGNRASTVEGNTNHRGSDEGEGVYAHARPLDDSQCVVVRL